MLNFVYRIRPRLCPSRHKAFTWPVSPESFLQVVLLRQRLRLEIDDRRLHRRDRISGLVAPDDADRPRLGRRRLGGSPLRLVRLLLLLARQEVSLGSVPHEDGLVLPLPELPDEGIAGLGPLRDLSSG